MAEASPRPDDPGIPTLEAPQAYRPLSLLAVLGLVLALFYALIVLVGGLFPFARAYPRAFVLLFLLAPVAGGLGAVLARRTRSQQIATAAGLSLAGVLVLLGLGGLVAFSGTAPWMLDWWAWMLLIGAVLVNLLALSRIRGSEGALAGRDLARCGLWLSVFFGANYLLYMAGNLFAVSSQARIAADRYIELIQNDQLPQAFVETLRPGTRPEGDVARAVEIEYNQPRGLREPGQYTIFCTSEVVQFLRLGSAGAKLVHKGATSRYNQGGYLAVLTYELTNDLGRFEIDITTQSVDAGGTRQWFVVGGESRIKPLDQTEEGKRLAQAVGNTQALARAWVGLFNAGRPEVAYLLTLPGTERTRLEPVHLATLPEVSALAGLAPLGMLSGRQVEIALINKGRADFQSGRMIDETGFLSDDRSRAEMLAEVRAYFKHANKTHVQSELLMSVIAPNFKLSPEGVEVAWPVRIAVLDHAGSSPRFIIDAEIVCAGVTKGEIGSLENYRVTSLRLLRGTTPHASGPLRKANR